MSKEKSDSIGIRRGVSQGDPLSQTLFNMLVAKILDSIDEDAGFQMGPCKAGSLAFEDDIVIVSSSKAGMQASINNVEETATTIGLKLILLNPARYRWF